MYIRADCLKTEILKVIVERHTSIALVHRKSLLVLGIIT